MNEIETIHACLTVGDFADSEYCKHAAVTMLSIEHDTQSKVKWHLVAGNENQPSPEVKIMFEKIGDVEFTYFDIGKKLPENLYSFKTFTKYSALRLFLPEIYPNINKMLYFDCDIVCNKLDIEELWDIPVNTIGAVIEGVYKKRCGKYAYKQLKSIGIATREYFNSGVLIMNLDNLRNLPELILTHVSLLKNTPYFDQDALNYFYPNALRISEKYNWIVEYHKAENSSNKILHFPTWTKPYVSNLYPETHLYWKYRSKIDTVDKIIELTLQLPNFTKTGLSSLIQKMKPSDLIMMTKLFVKIKPKQLFLRFKRYFGK